MAAHPTGVRPLYARIPAQAAANLDRAAFALGRPKQQLVAGLIEHHVDPDDLERLRELLSEPDGRRVTVEAIDEQLAVGRASFKRSAREVLTAEQTADLLQVDVDVVVELAESGELPGRRLGDEWRFARHRVLGWLADDAPATRPHKTGFEG